MNPFEFLATPIGIAVTLLFIALVFLIVRLTTESGKHQKHVKGALMANAKRQAEGRYVVVVPLRRKGGSLQRLFEHLASQQYKKLAILVVAYHTAGKYARRDVNALARQHGLSVKVVTHRKGLDMGSVIRAQPSTDFVMSLNADDRLTRDYFRKASYAFATGVDALEIRRITRPGISLVSAWRSLRAIFVQIMRLLWARRIRATGLVDGIIVRRRTMVRGQPYEASRLLYESFGNVRPEAKAGVSTVRSLGMLGVLTALLVLLFVTTPLAVLGYSLLLIGGVVGLAGALVVIQTVGLSAWDKVQLIALLPFYALYECGSLVGRSVRFVGATIQRLRRPRRSAPRLQRARIR